MKYANRKLLIYTSSQIASCCLILQNKCENLTPKIMIKSFDNNSLRNFSDVLAVILTHTRISRILAECSMPEAGGTNKSDRLYYAFMEKQRIDNCGNNIAAFIMRVITPKLYDDELSFEKDRSAINEKLAYDGLQIDIHGNIALCKTATTITEAKERSQNIKAKIKGMTIHQEIVRYCNEEWLHQDYFHAIEEIAKSVFDRLRKTSESNKDGAELIDECFALGKNNRPRFAFNKLETMSELSEHKGFANLCKGFYGLYRNPKAHSVRVDETTDLEDMSEVLIVATIIHNKLDNTFKTGF